MAYTLRLPALTGGTPEAQLEQLQGYLHQLTDDISFALNSLERGEVVVQQTTGGTAAIPGKKQDTPARDFGEIKALIIKSADVVNAFYEQVSSRFRGEYVAQSDFGTYREQTAQDIRQNSTDITQLLTDTQQIGEAVQEVKATIRSGRLYEDDDGTPVYGLEIGQQVEENGVQTFRKFARLTSDRLAFFDANGNEVAYISDKVLYITEARVEDMTATRIKTNQIQIGDYLLTAGADGHLTLT